MTPTPSPESQATSTPADVVAQQPKRSPRKVAAAVVTAGLVGGAAIGLFATMPSSTNAAAPATTVAPASTDPAPTGSAPADGDSDDAADRAAEHTAVIRESLQALVDDGTITAAQADAVAGHLATNGPVRPGRGGDHGPVGGPGGGKGPLMGADADAFAKVLGLTDAAALRTELQSGKTIAQIAEANGVEIETVKNYVLEQLKTHIDAAVEAGKLTQAEADAKLADADAKITEMINSNRGPRGPRGDRGDAGSSGATGDGPNIVQDDA